jgi:hypothetical protein
MLLKNKSARLITVNGSLNDKGERTEKYLIKPGKNPAVEVPDELCESAFVQSLIDNEDLIAVAGSPVKPELQGSPVKPDLKPRGDSDADDGESLYADFDKAQLVAQCEARDIEVKSRDTATQLIAKLEEADK